MTGMVSKITPAEALDILGLTPTDVVKKTGLGIDSVRRATLGGTKRINIKTARIVADFIGLPVNELSWPSGLSPVGRPPLSGGRYTIGGGTKSLGASNRSSVTDILRDDQASRITRRLELEPKYCENPEHNLVLPLSGVCDFCVA